MNADISIKYWLAVLARADELAEAFDEFFTMQDLGKISKFYAYIIS
jgi:hypothetical protein